MLDELSCVCYQKAKTDCICLNFKSIVIIMWISYKLQYIYIIIHKSSYRSFY